MSKAFDLSQAGRGRGITADLGAYRNKIINGDFDIWQRGSSQTLDGYHSVDRWGFIISGSTMTVLQGKFLPGGSDPHEGKPLGGLGYVSVTFAGGAVSGDVVTAYQRVEGLRAYAGRRFTLSFWARASLSGLKMASAFYRVPGTGGTPSPSASFAGKKHTMARTWQKFTHVVDVPAIDDLILGTNYDNSLQLNFIFSGGSSYDALTEGVGVQSGTIEIARVSLVEGDVTAEDDPFSPRHIQQELALCQRYYQRVQANVRFISTASGQFAHNSLNWPEMQATPTATLISAGSTSNINNNVLDNPSPYGGRITITSAAAGDAFIIGRVYGLDAEL
ncbi:hypothetical protein [Ochrobactrum soli]|uniref:Putative glycoprotein n=1 Tax=Ochrobactrum soli TaxID=2448455 RepID=A0A2P9HMK2_9HYPH|nr:hypothetical protein [[Ochrobactrum] soli]SPL65341.1 putative glycoprotein [[Ochrobactrum] soli]